MGLSTQQQVGYWGLAFAILIAFLWLMGGAMLPFLVGAAIAYLLNPLAEWLEDHGFNRVAATSLITLGVVIVLANLSFLVLPALAEQVAAILANVPEWIASLRSWLSATVPSIVDEESSLRRALAGMEDSLRSGGIELAKQVLSSTLAVFDLFLVVLLAPVVAFYLLLDWKRLIAAVDDLIPREHLETVRRLGRQVDEVLSGFVRGQLSVCVILGTFYALALMLIGLQFGVLVGLFAGLISFIPFVGSILGGLVSIGLALAQFWGEWHWVAAVAAVFIAGQAVEGNVLTPMMVGDKVRLHPVWLIFALSAFGAFLGFTGLLIAVPVAAVIGVLSRFGVAQYKSGRLYTGPVDRQDAAE